MTWDQQCAIRAAELDQELKELRFKNKVREVWYFIESRLMIAGAIYFLWWYFHLFIK